APRKWVTVQSVTPVKTSGVTALGGKAADGSQAKRKFRWQCSGVIWVCFWPNLAMPRTMRAHSNYQDLRKIVPVRLAADARMCGRQVGKVDE
ncbi:hypothetical protein ACVBEH_03275, partial [Roseateles sp. GG27B]